MRHIHTSACYARNDYGVIYVPCRKDGRDINRINWNRADFESALRVHSDGTAIKGAILICGH